MNAPPGKLFRKEVLERRADRLHGEVSINIPVSWQVIGFTLLGALAVALIFLFSASYSRIETVAGAIVLDRGVASIMPTRPGTVATLVAREGQQVAKGEALVEIRSEEDAASGRSGPGRIIDALEQQDGSLVAQSAMVMNAAGAEQSRAAAQIRGLDEEIASLDNQIVSQRRLVEVADNEFREVQGVAAKGFISRREVEVREGTLISRRQQLSQLQQARSGKTAESAQARRGIAQAGASAQAQAAGVQSTRAQLAQRLAEVETGRGYTLASPIDGTVTALTARLGQPVNQQQPLMVVMPSNATPLAELYVSTAAAGFLAVGQEVRLAVDAFPFQRFGTVKGRIVGISSVAIPKVGADGGAVPVYLVTAELDEPSVTAFGRKQPLLPGMTLSARIVTEKQSLFQWLFEPLFAVRGR